MLKTLAAALVMVPVFALQLQDAALVTPEGAQKLGTVCIYCDKDHYEALTPVSNWTYNYFLTPKENFPLDWANDNNVEFVPMIMHDSVWFTDENGKEKKCKMESGKNCSVEKFVEALEYTKSVVTTKYFMGFNEPYLTNDKGTKYIDPKDAALYWGLYVQPAAEQTELTLVSPTATIKSTLPIGYQWLADFYAECWNLRDSETPCDVWKIEAISVHNYYCDALFYEETYGGPDATFQRQMVEHLDSYGYEGIDWSEYINSRDLWMTETNCNQDIPKVSGSSGACQRVTGQQAEETNSVANQEVRTFGQGSIQQMMQMEQFTRIAWWSAMNPNQTLMNVVNAQLVNPEYEVRPTGRAWNNFFDEETNCDDL